MKKKFIFSAILWSLVMVIGQVFGCIFAIIKMAITMPNFEEYFTTADIYDLISELTNPMLVGGSIAIFIAIVIRVSMINNPNKTWGQKCKDYLNLKPLKNGMEYVRYFCVGITINVVLSLILTGLYELLQIEESIEYMFKPNLLMLILVSFLVPIGEEIVYRNRIYISLKNATPKHANWIQALIFGIQHGNVVQGIYTFAFGLIFGKINDYNRSLLPSICVHCGINFYAGITMFSPGSEIYLIPFIVFAIPKFIEWTKLKRFS